MGAGLSMKISMSYRDFKVRASAVLWVAAALVSAASVQATEPQTRAAGPPDPLVAMFVWWNAAYKQKDGFTAEAFSKYFTSDTVLRVNGKDRSVGVEELASHFRDIQKRTE